MADDLNAELRRLKRDFLDMERANREEKDLLVRIAHTLGAALAADPELAARWESLKALLDPDKPLAFDRLESEVRLLKDGILAREQPAHGAARALEEVERLKGRLLESRRTLARVMLPLLEDFYPFNSEVAVKASAIQVGLKEESADPVSTTRDFREFIGALKAQIQEDFRYVQSGFVSLLNHVKDLEKSLSQEFGGEENLKKVGYFELQVNEEVGSIMHSFNLYSTVAEIKSAVVNKIQNIKRIIALKKEEDMKSLLSAQKDVQLLRNRIADAEKEVFALARRAQDFQNQALKDGLTGLYNRKAFDAKLSEALERQSLGGASFALILLDVNEFKSINDTFGHMAGDKVLQKVAQSLQETFRKGDFIARFGGDEFAVIIEEMTRDMGAERIAGFNRNLAKRRFTSYKKGDITVKVSAGLALAEGGDTPESLLDRADKAMYGAKPKVRI